MCNVSKFASVFSRQLLYSMLKDNTHFPHKKRGLKENILFKSKETVHSFLIVLLKMEKGSQNKNCHFLELCLNMILSILLHEEDQSQVADIARITWESEEAVLIYTSCRTDSKTIMLFWFGVGVFFLWLF